MRIPLNRSRRFRPRKLPKAQNTGTIPFKTPTHSQSPPGEVNQQARAAEQPGHNSEQLLPSLSPRKPRYWADPTDSTVRYAAGKPNDIHQVLASIVDKSTLRNTIVVLKDQDDPQRPLFLITALASKWFPPGNWQAYLYHTDSLKTDDYRLIGKLTITIEPHHIPHWQTWRFLSRHIRQLIDPSNNRRLRAGNGLRIATEPHSTE